MSQPTTTEAHLTKEEFLSGVSFKISSDAYRTEPYYVHTYISDSLTILSICNETSHICNIGHISERGFRYYGMFMGKSINGYVPFTKCIRS